MRGFRASKLNFCGSWRSRTSTRTWWVRLATQRSSMATKCLTCPFRTTAADRTNSTQIRASSRSILSMKTKTHRTKTRCSSTSAPTSLKSLRTSCTWTFSWNTRSFSWMITTRLGQNSNTDLQQKGILKCDWLPRQQISKHLASADKPSTPIQQQTIYTLSFLATSWLRVSTQMARCWSFVYLFPLTLRLTQNGSSLFKSFKCTLYS